MRLCPFCQESIQPKAILCRHCGTNLGEVAAAARKAAAEKRSIKIWSLVLGVIGCVVLLCVAAYVHVHHGLKAGLVCAGIAMLNIPGSWLGIAYGLERNKQAKNATYFGSSLSKIRDQQTKEELTGGLIMLFGAPVVCFLLQVSAVKHFGSAAMSTDNTVAVQDAAAPPPTVAAPSAVAISSTTEVQASDSSVTEQPSTMQAASPQPTQITNAQPVAQVDQTAEPAQTPETQQPTAAAAIVASFDCAKAASRIEKLICSTPVTADADRRLGDAYRAAIAKASDPDGLKAQERDWMKQRNACTTSACLVAVINDRIQQLSPN